MTASQRVDIKQSDVNKAENEDVRGVTVKVMLSPFDVPQSAFADYNRDDRVVRLTFDYIGGDEPTIEKSGGEGITLIVGKHSDRLYGIKIAVAGLAAGKGILRSELFMNAAEDKLAQFRQSHPEMKSRSFEAVNRVLKHYSASIQPILQQALVEGS